MADQTARGEEFERKAEKKLTGWGIFGSKHEDAADLYEKAANCYKLGKNWDKAGAVYTKMASCHLKSDSKHEAASAYVDAANCYKKNSAQDAAQSLNQAVNLFMEIGRLNMAARYYKELGDIYEQEQNLDKSMDYFERAADLFLSEEVTTSANQCKQKVAQFAAQLEQYPKAIEIFEAIARHSINNSLLKYGVKGILLNAGICELCKGDIVAINNALERYQELDPTFSGTREYKLLADLAASMDEEDVIKFTEAIKEFDSMTRLDPWKTTLLLRAKNALKAKENEEDDLT
ncbi:alpha-soluble NSF attachment protein-like [Phalaenopsis equestris]|uniref:alpha-soluble NSF attachment protein-like n=1 Tax=Phalaenopsis equestris TaxID=78828 RepID=UPI0009E488C2|nr:alpha-soluble NSF attachment protein-like [Phalaenopsis equestris]